MMVIKTIFFLLVLVVFTRCTTNNTPVEKAIGVVADSCKIDVKVKNGAGPMLDLIVTFETVRDISVKSSNNINFLMNENLSLYADSVVYMPVFCQPIATGVKNKYQYWVSFEAGNISNRDAILQISNNELVRTTVNYKL
jgi:hypothetical protein